MSSTSLVCRSCGYDNLASVLSLGQTPLANALLTFEQLTEAEKTYALDLVFCSNCALVQITETVPPEQLFREYLYFSSFSDTMLQHAKVLAYRLITSHRLSSNSLVIEVASNDGYLLQYYQTRGVPVLGIEPAINIARVAQEERGIDTLCEFFDRELAQRLKDDGQQADVIHANNVLAHVPDLNGFVAGLELLLKPRGVAVIEVPYVKDLIDYVEFDTIYHEHLCYFSLTSLDRLFQRHRLLIVDVERIPIHGGSLRIFVEHGNEQKNRSDAVCELLQEEVEWGVDQIIPYRAFATRVDRLRQDLLALISDLKTQGMQIAVYGASAKGSTLLNYFGLDGASLDFVVDRSTVKQGFYTPGAHLPIYAPEKLLEEQPDYVLLLTWNFVDEILAQQAEFRRQGGRFIIPIPEVRIV